MLSPPQRSSIASPSLTSKTVHSSTSLSIKPAGGFCIYTSARAPVASIRQIAARKTSLFIRRLRQSMLAPLPLFRSSLMADSVARPATPSQVRPLAVW